MSDASFEAARAFHRAGEFDKAAAEYRKLLNLQPEDPHLLHLLGLVTAQAGRPTDGEKLIQQAINLRPQVAIFHENMGYVLRRLDRSEAAVTAYRQAVTLDPQSLSAWLNLGHCLVHIGDQQAAIEAYNHVLAIEPNQAVAHNELGAILREQGRIDESLDCFRRAIELNPNYAEANHNLALTLAHMGRVHDAIQFESRAIELAPHATAFATSRNFFLHFDPHYDRAGIQTEMRDFNHRFAEPLAIGITPHLNNRDPNRPLKIGYVSPNFYLQAEAFFVLPLLQNHDHRHFQIHCYSSVLKPDSMTEQLRKCADVWHDVAAETDELLSNHIRADGIDILVDLTMHMRQNRLLLFARKPAPVQATWLAYPGGTGLTAIDYRLTDPHLDPPECDHFYSEKSIRLPGCWCCFDPLSDTPIDSTQDKDFVRFASMNNPAKLNDPTLLLWSRVLKSASNSKLLLLVSSNDHCRRISQLFAGAGVDPNRLEFTGYLSRSEYLAIYNKIDLCLDPAPYNGITTTLDALWMGVPVVTLIGRTAPGRAGLSILSTFGMPELIAHSPEEFIEIAPRGRTISREELRKKFRESPLMDGKLFAGNIERAYREMWHRFAAQSSP